MDTLTAISWRFDYNTSRQRIEEETTRPIPSLRWNDEVFRQALHRGRNLLGLFGNLLVKRLRTYATPAYGLDDGCSENGLRKSEMNGGWCSPLL